MIVMPQILVVTKLSVCNYVFTNSIVYVTHGYSVLFIDTIS